jgi:DNA-binding IclR family transcriptional regulator
MASGEQQGIRSLETGIRLFQELHRLCRPATLSELSRLSHMPPGKVHRYCVSLIRTGLMQQDARGLYGVGPYGFQIRHAPADMELARTLAAAALPRLVAEINETAFLSSWGEVGPTIFKVEDPAKPISIRPNWRGDLPLWNSAAGRVFAAYMPDDKLGPLINAEFEAQRRSERLSAAEIERRRRTFDRHLGDIRKHGVGRTTGERYPGIISFAAPIFDRDGRVLLAITTFGLAASMSAAWDGSVPEALRTTARELTKRIGGRNPSA